MVTGRGVFALMCALALGSITLVAQKGDQQKPAPRKLSDAQKKDLQAVLKAVDDAAAGQQPPNDLALTWVHENLLKAQSNKQYVPFTIKIDAAKVAAGSLSLYWRVVDKAAAPPPAAPGKKDDKKETKRPEFAFEDFGTVQSAAAQNRISRAFMAAAGDYDVWVAVKESIPDKAPKNAPPSKISVLKHSIAVPDFWNGELNTSVIVAQRIDPLPAPLTPEQQVERPYALGAIEIIPAVDTKFSKMAELSTFVMVYNAKPDSANRPDVVIEYNFYAKQAGAEKFFNKTSPQNLNAETLPPQFYFAAGLLQSGQAVPLSSFPECEYRLEIKITDKIANKSLTRDVNFTVTSS